MSNGNPRCPLCAGKGGTFSNGAWRKCACTKVSAAQRESMQRLHSIGTPLDRPNAQRRRP